MTISQESGLLSVRTAPSQTIDRWLRYDEREMSTQSCIVCQSSDSSRLFSTWDRHYGIPGKFNIARCKSCGLVHLDPIPTETELAGFYDENYYAYEPMRTGSRLRNFAKQ